MYGESIEIDAIDGPKIVYDYETAPFKQSNSKGMENTTKNIP